MMTIAILFAFASFIMPSQSRVESWNLDQRPDIPALNKRTHDELIIHFESAECTQRLLIRFGLQNTTSIKAIVSQILISDSKFEATQAHIIHSDQGDKIGINSAINSIRRIIQEYQGTDNVYNAIDVYGKRVENY